MGEFNTQAALGELEGSNAEPTNAGETQETAVEYFELPYSGPYDGKTLRLPMNYEVPIKSDGGIQKVALSNLLNKYRLATHLERKQTELKDKLTTYEKQVQEYGDPEEIKMLKQIQKWSVENPDQFDQVWQAMQNGGNIAKDDPYSGKLSALEQQIRDLAEFKKSVMEERQSKEEEAQVNEVKSEIEAFSKEFSHINLEEQDLDGISLRGRILQFGADNNYPTFRAAALDYKFPDGTPLLTKLIDTVKREGRNEAVKAVKQDNKNGILSRSSVPFGQSKELDVRSLKNDDRYEMALDELSRAWNSNNQ